MSLPAAVSVIENYIAKEVGKAFPFSATVSALSNGMVQIKRLGASTAESQLYARLTGQKLTVGDEVICVQYLGAAFVLGKVQRAAPAATLFDAGLVNPDGAFGPSRADTATTASTTNTATFVDAYSDTWTLPAGTFTVMVLGSLTMKRNPAGQANLRLVIDGTNSATRVVNCDASIWSNHIQVGLQAGVSGGRAITVKISYKGDTGTGVTTSAIEPLLWVAVVRTA